MTRGQRYAEVNAILRRLYWFEHRKDIGSDRMYAKELNEFEEYCPQFDSLSDDRSEDFGPNRYQAVIEWRQLKRPVGEEHVG